jgi:acetyl-CoA carboxylase biotin carboxyl carrier protein
VDKSKAEPAAQAKDLHEVKSPIVGSFYRAPSPDAEPYVRVGDRVFYRNGFMYC